MSREEEFDKFLQDTLQDYDLETCQKITENEYEFMRGYFNAVKDLPSILINARQMTHDDNYPMLNDFIDGISKIMYDETKEGMEANLENYLTAIIENHIN